MLSASLGVATDAQPTHKCGPTCMSPLDALFLPKPIHPADFRTAFPKTRMSCSFSPVMIRRLCLKLENLAPHWSLLLAPAEYPRLRCKVKAWAEKNMSALADGETLPSSLSKTYTVVGVMEPLPR